MTSLKTATVKLREVAEILPGRYLPREYYASGEGPYTVYGSNSIMGLHTEYLYEGPLVVLARIGSNCGAVMWSSQPAWINNNASALRAKRLIDTRYLYYWLRVHDMRPHRRGSGQPFISHESLAEAEMAVPPIAEQQAIVELLGALDDKIGANERLVRVCDELWLALATQALDMAAREPTNTIPLTGLASFVNGRAFTKGATGIGRMVIRIAELNSGPGASTVYNEIDVPDRYLARQGDLLFAWSGSLTVQRWFRDEAIVNQHIFKVIPEVGVPLWLVHAHLLHLLDEFRAIAADKATTMGHIQRRHLEVPVPRLASSHLASADAKCGPLWLRALAAEREILALTMLRDTLLQPLISGELPMREAEELVGEAV